MATGPILSLSVLLASFIPSICAHAAVLQVHAEKEAHEDSAQNDPPIVPKQVRTQKDLTPMLDIEGSGSVVACGVCAKADSTCTTGY